MSRIFNCRSKYCHVFRCRAIEIGEAIHAHPTMTEVLQEAALDTYGLAIPNRERLMKMKALKNQVYQKKN